MINLNYLFIYFKGGNEMESSSLWDCALMGGIWVLGHVWIWNASIPKRSLEGERFGEQSTSSAVELLPSALLSLF